MIKYLNIIFIINLCFATSNFTFEYSSNTLNDSLFIMSAINGEISISGSDDQYITLSQQLDPSDNSVNIERGNLKSENGTLSFLPQPGLSLSDNNIYDISVPKEINIKLDLYGGNLNISNINGDIYVTKLSGNIRMTDIIGTSNISTGEGFLELINISGDCVGKVLEGNIEVQKSNGDFTLNTGSGNISIKNSEGNVDLKTYVGNCTLQNLDGKIINTSTKGGNIYIKSITADSSYFKTLAGDIHAENIDGIIISETYGGIIEAKNITGDIIFENYTGNITAENIHGRLNINAYSGDVFINRFIPDKNIGRESTVKIISGDLALTFVDENTALELNTQGGKISSNIAVISKKFPYSGKYTPKNESHKIVVSIFKGDIVINRGEFNE
jgi:DUF4097 and DUF4098 domain-containing protein YvlB